jgi:XRE family transcriptional regulator, regulator of sulfur utilization
MPINVGPVVRRLRERHRMTQQDLVEYTGLDRSSSYISSIETGRTSPTLYELEQIARVYQVPLQELLQEGGQAADAGAAEPLEDRLGPRLAALYEGLSPEDQALAVDFLHLLADRERRRAT